MKLNLFLLIYYILISKNILADRPSRNYKGLCISPFNTKDCSNYCIKETHKIGYCSKYRCWCRT
ncbi:hypothetical protein Mgra_00003883 [Meloidogyne graminicola]|uniref:Knottins-like domain-containing protein n=1 Tax=Meloidogyne graminicola TaxID=189291 RepID=A0A8S9ZTU3_9BILA|nr:hypothetical protein Mgra_00003883 [Meloidogyne graminicola]